MSEPAPAAVLVLAAGQGERLGHALPKAFVPLAGRTLLEWSIDRLARSGQFQVVQPVLPALEIERYASLGLKADGLASPVAGGAERQDSMGLGLASLPEEIGFVAVHDAARCLVSPSDVQAVVEAARVHGAALLGERSRDTIKRVRDGFVVETPDRAECWAAQTPQVVRRDWLEAAIESARRGDRLGTDDAQLIEWAGHPVRMVESLHPNPKITHPEDLLMAEALLEQAESDASMKKVSA